MPRKAEQCSSHSKASAEANVPAVEGRLANHFLLDTHSNLPASSGQPQCSTHGMGGARAQLANVAERIRPDLNQGVK